MSEISIDNVIRAAISACLFARSVIVPGKVRNQYGANLPSIVNQEDCVGCRMCERMCTDGAITVERKGCNYEVKCQVCRSRRSGCNFILCASF